STTETGMKHGFVGADCGVVGEQEWAQEFWRGDVERSDCSPNSHIPRRPFAGCPRNGRRRKSGPREHRAVKDVPTWLFSRPTSVSGAAKIWRRLVRRGAAG